LEEDTDEDDEDDDEGEEDEGKYLKETEWRSPIHAMRALGWWFMRSRYGNSTPGLASLLPRWSEEDDDEDEEDDNDGELSSCDMDGDSSGAAAAYPRAGGKWRDSYMAKAQATSGGIRVWACSRRSTACFASHDRCAAAAQVTEALRGWISE